MNDTSGLIEDSARRIFREWADPRNAIDEAQRAKLWHALEEAGLTRTWTSESLGGVGASLADGFALARLAGEFALSVPLVEHLLACWLLEQANISIVDGIGTVTPCATNADVWLDRNGRIGGVAHSIPFGRDADWVALLVRDSSQHVALINRKSVKIAECNNIAAEPRDQVTFNGAEVIELRDTNCTYEHLEQMGATLRSLQIAGALQGMLDLTVTYANERIAFEKPIGKFQAVQHSLAKLAGETAAAVAAASSAADAIATSTTFDEAAFLEVASAKIRVGEAVTTATAIAHQVHGAIGFTDEHVLHRYTQRLWAWRDDFGNESQWALRLGQYVANRGPDALWPMLAAR